MNPFQAYGHPYQGQPFPTNYPVLTQICSTPFYYESGSHGHLNSTASFSPSSMYNISSMPGQTQNQITAFPPRRSSDTNEFNQLLQKIDNDIQANNQLFREDYLKLLKQRTTVQEKLKEISDIEDFSSKITALERLAHIKPKLHDALVLRDRINYAYEQTEFSEINLIIQDIEACEAVTRKIHDFLAKYNSKVKNYSNTNPYRAKEFGEITRGLNGLKKEIRLLILKDTDALHQWENFEWYLKVKLELIKQPGSLQLCDLEHWNGLKDFASTSEIIGSKQFEKICQQIHFYEGIKEKVEKVKKQENLILQNKENKEATAEIRKKLLKKIEVEALLKEINGCYIRVTQEKAYIEELIQRAKNITNLYTQRKIKQKRLSQNQFHNFLRLFERLPMLTLEEEEINTEKIKAEQIIKSIDNNPMTVKSSLDIGFAKNVYEQYKNCFVEIPSAKKVSDFYLKSQRSQAIPEEICTPQAPAEDSAGLLRKRSEPFNSDSRRSKLSTTSKSEGEISHYKDSRSPSSPPKEKLLHTESSIKMNIEQSDSAKKIKNESNNNPPEIKVVISDFRRLKANTEILDSLRNVRDLPKDKNPGMIAKSLEEKVYNRYLNNRDQYSVRVASICTFFGDMNYSTKTQQKVFKTTMEYEHIREYLGQHLEQDNPKPVITFDEKQRKIINTGKMQIETPPIQNYQPINEIMNYPDYLSAPPPPPSSKAQTKKSSKHSWNPKHRPNRFSEQKPPGLTIKKPNS